MSRSSRTGTKISGVADSAYCICGHDSLKRGLRALCIDQLLRIFWLSRNFQPPEDRETQAKNQAHGPHSSDRFTGFSKMVHHRGRGGGVNVAGRFWQGPQDGICAERRGFLLRKCACIWALARRLARKLSVHV